MKKYKWILILLNLIVLLVFFNRSVMEKERLLKEGKLILLELAPVDPRSLMQGDYLSLRYKIGQSFDSIPSERGYCVVRLQADGVANGIRLQEHKTPLDAGEQLIKYRNAKYEIRLGAESFFFQEGLAEKYDDAKYGGLKVDKDGNSLLVGLYDEQLKKIE
ncbi:MAG: GDYXXLXY domain-containing protein [Candidatus Azobacteroides sp.]|nr:GDYXXLXY domain-containing protein [Candidatus Azobacteroides sp.]